MTLDSSGNLGIGTTTMTRSFNISGTNPGIGLNINNTGTSGRSFSIFSTNSSASVAGVLGFYDDTAGAYRMVIDSSGNLGIGTTSPSGKLHIQRASAGNLIYANDGVAAGLTVSTSGFGCFLDTQSSSGFFAFTKNGGATEFARIDSSGNLLVGTTSTSVTSGGIYNRATDAAGSSVIIGHQSGVATGNSFAEFQYAGGLIGYISQVGTTAVTYNSVSDYRLKTVIGPVANAGQRIDALQPVEYTWNADGSRSSGFLAHQFQEVYASSVSGTKDAVDAEGKPVYQAMQASTSEVIADLVAEIQSLRKRLAALESA